MTDPYEPHPDATALTAFRVTHQGRKVRAYTVMEPDSGWQGIEHSLRTASALGYVTEADGFEYAVLSVLDDHNTELQEFGIPGPNAFQWWYRRLGLRLNYERSTP